MRVDLGGSKPRLTCRCGWRWIRMNTGDLHDVQGVGGFEALTAHHGETSTERPSNSSRVFPSMRAFCAPACLCLQDE